MFPRNSLSPALPALHQRLGGRPGREKVHSNKSVLLNCLQSANFSLTNDQLDAVMDRYRPGGRAAQAPRLRDSAAGSPLKTSSAFTRLT